MASLYVTATMYGAGVGIWIDAEAFPEGEVDPGLALIAPIVLGAAAPATVWAIDTYAFRRGMPEGMPSAIAAGLLIGAGEGLGIAGFQWVTADCPRDHYDIDAGEVVPPEDDFCDEWGFRGLARAEVVGATVGGAAGVGAYYLLKPYPETNVMWTSSIFWGTTIGAFFGGGASNGPWGQANDGVALGGLIGFNVGLAAAVGASIFWTPSWNQLGWMWGGFAIGSAAGALVYPFYLLGGDPRRGLIVQAITGIVGLGLGAAFATPRRSPKKYADSEEYDWEETPIRIYGAGIMPVNSGVGVQVEGGLW
jgi:hypothetical protein